MPLSEGLLTIRHSTNKLLNKNDLYAVTLKCGLGRSGSLEDWNPFVATNLVTSHIVAITNARLSQPELPSNTRAAVTVFSIAGDAKARKIFLNKNCKTQFLISGRESLFIAATANQATTNQPGPLTRVLYEAIQVAIPILPLIKGTSLASTMVTDIGKTRDPLTKMFAELDKGRTYTKSDDLYQGDNFITTPYSKVKINVSKVKSLLDPGNDDFLKIFEDAIDAAETPLALGSATTPGQKCGEFANSLKGRNFSPPDIAYALILISQAANLNPLNTIECLSKRICAYGACQK